MIRAPRRSDQGYIAATWARSMLSTHAHQRHLRSRSGQQIGKQIDAVLDRPDTRALLYVRDEDADAILGWMLYVDGPAVPVVHYLYVRKEERGRGIASALLRRLDIRRDTGVVCTSHGPSSETLRGRYKASLHMPLADFLEPG